MAEVHGNRTHCEVYKILKFLVIFIQILGLW